MSMGRKRIVGGWAYCQAPGEDGKIREVYGFGETEEEAKASCMKKQGKLKGKLFPLANYCLRELSGQGYNHYNRILKVDKDGVAYCNYTSKSQKDQVKLSIVLPPEIHEKLTIAAEEAGVSASRYIANLINAHSSSQIDINRYVSREEMKNRILRILDEF